MCKRILMRVKLDSAGHPRCPQYADGRCLLQGDLCVLDARTEPDGRKRILG